LVNKTVLEQSVKQGSSNTKQLKQLRTMACSLEVTKQHPSMSCLPKLEHEQAFTVVNLADICQFLPQNMYLFWKIQWHTPLSKRGIKGSPHVWNIVAKVNIHIIWEIMY